MSYVFPAWLASVRLDENEDQVRSGLQERLLPVGLQLLQVGNPFVSHATLVVDLLLHFGDVAYLGLQIGVRHDDEGPRLGVSSARSGTCRQSGHVTETVLGATGSQSPRAASTESACHD